SGELWRAGSRGGNPKSETRNPNQTAKRRMTKTGGRRSRARQVICRMILSAVSVNLRLFSSAATPRHGGAHDRISDSLAPDEGEDQQGNADGRNCERRS